MILAKQTISLCPECYEVIPALVNIHQGGVWMHKTCKDHGEVIHMIEKDPVFYMLASMQKDKQFYGGSIVDVTSRCNTTCKYCFNERDSNPDPSIETILEHCSKLPPPYHLYGGEPTVREDLPELIEAISKQYGNVYLVTNGINLEDDWYLRQLRDAGLESVCISLNLPDHQTEEVFLTKLTAIRNVNNIGMKFGVSFVIDDLEQINWIVNCYMLFYSSKEEVNRANIRIRLASNIRATQNVTEDIFMSEVYNTLEQLSIAYKKPFQFTAGGNTTHYFNVVYDHTPIILVKFPDRFDIDLQDYIGNMPYTMSKSGKVLPFFLGMLANERLAKGL